MISIGTKVDRNNHFILLEEGQKVKIFQSEFLKYFYDTNYNTFYIGVGKINDLTIGDISEIFAKITKLCKEFQIKECSISVNNLVDILGERIICGIAQGLVLGSYTFLLEQKEQDFDCNYHLLGLADLEKLEESVIVAKSILFTKDMVNLPGNYLRPLTFAEKARAYLEGTNIEVEILVSGKLRAMGMEGITSIGSSSEYPPCLLVLRYKPMKEEAIMGLIGKGVTCDSGGYCLKPASSMAGIKGDMAGAATVISVMKSLALNYVKKNVVAIIPICENRISNGSLLPGDVITLYNGTKVEVLNTDAEGRLILADAISYGIKNENITEILDIATLTGQVYATLGHSITGVISSSDKLSQQLQKASITTGEHFLRFPYLKEHEKMIESKVATIKNTGGDCCGTITAGMFIKHFTEKLPWIHLDIAGTAWVDSPKYEYQQHGATGTCVSSIYYMIKENC